MSALERLARAAGIAVVWRDADGKDQRVAPDNLRAILTALGHDIASEKAIAQSQARLARQAGDPPLRVVWQGAGFAAKGRSLRLIAEDGTAHVLPVRQGKARATLPPGYYRLAGTEKQIAVAPRQAFQPQRRGWGVSVQLYALRGSPGIGDFGALGSFCEQAARAGAGAVMLSPVHAVPQGGISPYTPTSRQFLNPLYIPLAGSDDGGALIDWTKAARQREIALRRDYRRFEKTGDPAFDRFVRQGGAGLKQHARFMAGHRDEARFQLYLQWRADTALAAAQARAKAAGMAIGLIADVAVGLDPGGSEAQGNAAQMLNGLSIGAPPDAFNANGQDWGLTGFSPAGLNASGYAGFIAMLRAAMRHAGGIRLDHAMGLMRLWVVPRGKSPRDGAYLHYPFEDLLGLVCLESQRHQALVIAEDLGTVPPGFRERIFQAGLLGMEVLWFARGANGAFRPPITWPAHSAALTTTHDLPTLAGWWRGRDLEWRDRIAGHADKKAQRQRAADRRALWRALKASGAKGPLPRNAATFTDAAIAALGKAPSPLALVAVEDLTGAVEQPNIPGTIDEHPNWRRRLDAKAPFAVTAARRRAALLKDGRS